MKWSEMSARERDKLVCEKVFGWKKFACMEAEDDFYVVDDLQELHAMYPVPFYTTSIADAWQVVEKLKLNNRVDIVVDDDYYVTVYDVDGMDEASAPTAPEAICKAALKAVGVDID